MSYLRIIPLAALAVVCVLTPRAAVAQESRGAITGQVTDASGAVVAGVTVRITNLDTQQVFDQPTNESGAYNAPLLLPGNYRVEAEHAGFKKYVRRSITVSVNDRIQLDIQLEVGDATQTIDVSADAPVVETVDPSLGHIITTKELTELPIAHGNPYALIALAPGVTFEGDQKLNRPYEPTHIVDYGMNGTTSGTTDITLDGVSNTAKGSNGKVSASYVPPVDAIGEVKVQTNAFDAKVGQTSGAVVNISLRSGANKFHVTGAYNKMQPSWMANDWFANRLGVERGDFVYDRWSTSVSGPVTIPKVYKGRNRTFFMWAYEGLRDTRPRGNVSTVPTQKERGGDFSELLAIGTNYQIYNPFTRRRAPSSSTRYQQDPFPDNVIPRSLLNPIALKVLEYIPMPLSQGTTNDFRNNLAQPNATESTLYKTNTVRIDHNLSQKHRFYVRGNIYDRDSESYDWFKTRASGQSQRFLSRGGSVDDVYTFSPSLILNVRYGYSRYIRLTNPLRGRNFDLTTLGFPGSFNDAISPDLREFPVFGVAGYFSTINVGEQRAMDTHSLVAAFTRIAGPHTWEFGLEARAYRQNRYNMSTTQSGRFDFDPTWTRGPLDNSTTAPIGQGMASFLLGLPRATNSYLSRNGDFAEQSTAWMGYVQDTWRFSRRLNLTLGVRYELEGPLTERFDRSIRDFDFNAVLPFEARARAAYAAAWEANPTYELPPDQFKVRGGLVFAGVNGDSRELWNRDWNNLMPRVGVAYAINPKTVFRGGYGMYFSGLGMRRTDVLQNGFSRRTNFVPTRDSGLTFYSTLSNPFPDGILEPAGSSPGALTDLGNSVEFFTSKPVAPYSQRWQASIQRQIGKSSMVEAAYVGNRGTKLEIDRDLNIVGNDLLSRSPVFDQSRVNYLTANLPNPFYGIAEMGTMGANINMTRENLLKPFLQFSALNTTTYQGYSWYHSLQLRTMRRFSRSFNLTGSYTWAKYMEATGFLNAGDDMPYESLASQDHKHRVTASVMYDMPFGRRRRFLNRAPKAIDAVAGGWQVSGMYIYQDGTPLTWQDAIFLGDPSDINNGPKTAEQWFNTASGFTKSSSTRPSYHYRTWPFRFSNIRTDGINNWDLSALKRAVLGERGRELQVRVDFLNAWNRKRFRGPNMDQFNSAFGQITDSAAYPRQIQAALRVTF